MLTFDHVVFNTLEITLKISQIIVYFSANEYQVKDDGNVINMAPDIGCFINGMYLDGAVWCSNNHYLIEPKDGILFDEMPTVSNLLSVTLHIKFFPQIDLAATNTAG